METWDNKPVINRVLSEHHMSFDPPMPTVWEGIPRRCGVSYAENGDTTLTLFAPGANKVEWIQRFPSPTVTAFAAEGDGSFTCVIPWRSELSGPMPLEICVDGVPVIYKNFPVGWLGNTLMNVIDIPSVHGALWSIRDNPHGAVCGEIFRATVLDDFQRCMVYTPPGYMKDGKSYPVLYMLHGGGANELDWFYSGHAAHIFDNLIAEGKIEPFIAVATNGMVRYPDSGRVVWDCALEDLLVQDLIPYIDSHYRTKPDKWNRGICGLSMGSYMTNDIGFRHPELFGYMGQFTACMTHYIDFPNYERPFLALLKEMEADPEEFGRRYKVFFRSTTRMEDHFDYFENDDAMLARAGIDRLPCNHRVVYPGKTSKWESWRLGLYDFVQLIFR